MFFANQIFTWPTSVKVHAQCFFRSVTDQPLPSGISPILVTPATIGNMSDVGEWGWNMGMGMGMVISWDGLWAFVLIWGVCVHTLSVQKCMRSGFHQTVCPNCSLFCFIWLKVVLSFISLFYVLLCVSVVPGIELRSWGLKAGAFTCWTISL